MTLKNISLFITFLLLTILPALAGRETGGGYATKINQQLFLYDFVESGIESQAHIPPLEEDRLGALKKLRKLEVHGRQLFELIVAKINQINEKNAFLAELILELFESYEWNLVGPEVLPNNDIGSSPISKERLELVPIAFRNDKRGIVTINRSLFKELDHSNQVGLFFHEVIYGLLKSKLQVSSASTTRMLTSVLFNPSFVFLSHEQLIEKVKKISGLKILANQDYQYTLSPEFAEKCSAFKDEFGDKLVHFLKHYDVLVNFLVEQKTSEGMRGNNNCGKYIMRKGYPVTYRGETYTFISNLPLNSRHDFYNKFHHKIYYCMPTSELNQEQQQSLTEVKATKKEIIKLEREVNLQKFFNQCLSETDVEIFFEIAFRLGINGKTF